jgi:uncharacterized protein (TIGR03032 family)
MTNQQPQPQGRTYPPFSCMFSPDFPDLLIHYHCSLIISTYQAGRVIIISAGTEDNLHQLPRAFPKPMGMTVDGPRLAIATRTAVMVLRNAPDLAASYPRQPDTYDGLYVPQAIYFTSELDLHDMAWGTDGLWAVNTRSSCLALINDQHSFTPRWQPPFVSSLRPEDRCHLNGLAMENGHPRYVTALGTTDSPGGWRPNRLTGGILMDVTTNEIILEGLPLPHSPRLIDGRLLMLFSSTGELVEVDPAARRYEVITRLPGFARGLVRYGDYLFIGISRVRKRHIFSEMPVAKKEPFSGIVAVHLPSGRIAGSVKYLASCEEIYDVQVLPQTRRPGILNADSPLVHTALSAPGVAGWGRLEQPDAAGDAATPPTADEEHAAPTEQHP